MKQTSKRVTQLKALITKKNYTVFEAICLLKQLQSAQFQESMEAHISLNIDPKYADQQLRASLTLPNGTGKEIKIAVFTEPENMQYARDYGANIVGFDNLLEEISRGNTNFDVLITTPELMPKLTKLGKILGPKSLMPSIKSGTVTQNVEETIKEFKKGKFEYRSDKAGIVHLAFGKSFFEEKALIENLFAVYKSIEKNKPSGAKGKYFNSFYLCTTMSPSLRLDLSSFKI